MLEPFSANYFLGRFHVYPTEAEQASMYALDYEVLQDFYNGDGPLVMKLASRHFTVTSDGDVPFRGLEVPEPILDAAGINRAPAQTDVLVAKNEWIAEMLGL